MVTETIVSANHLVTFKHLNMKKNINIKYFKILFLLVLSNMINAQTIVDITSNNTFPSDYNKTGLYYEKDIHNYLDNFVGTWEYINGNDKFQIILTKITKYHYVNNDLNLNIYEDGISVSYRKYVNNNLIYNSPTPSKPALKTYNGDKLEGFFIDYGRVTVQVNWPAFSNMGILHQGGEYYRPTCKIERMSPIVGQPERIKFKLYLENFTGGMGNPYKNPLYNGLPTLSVPNMVVMRKVP